MKFLRFLPTFLLIGVLAAVVMVPQIVAHAAPAVPAPMDPSPVGTWSMTVSLADGSQEHALTQFETDGGCLETSAALPQPGLGDWKQLSPVSFESRFVKQLRNDQGAYLGFLRVHMIANFLDPNHFAGEGQGQVYDARGKLISTSQSKVNGVLVVAQS